MNENKNTNDAEENENNIDITDDDEILNLDYGSWNLKMHKVLKE